MALTKPFCENGNKKTIPQTTTSDGSVSYDQGFGASYALPPEEGGLFIDRAQFNQLMYDTTSAVIDNSDNIATIQGDVTTAKANITTLQQKTSNLENSVSNINNTISQVISSNVAPVKLYNEKITKTIGDRGDFSDLSSAFQWALGYRSKVGIDFNLVSDIEITTNLNLFMFDFVTLNFNGFKIKGSNASGVASNFIKFGNMQINLYRVNIEDITLIVAEGAYVATFGTINARRTIAKTGQYALLQASSGGFLNIYSFEEGVIDCGGFDGSSGLFASAGGTITRTSATLNLQINNANGANASALKVIQGGTIVNTRYFKTTGSTNQTNITKNTLSEEGYIL